MNHETNTMEKPLITQSMQMQEIMTLYPSAKRALFQKYHIGGCQSCGYAPEETLQEVMANHNKTTDLNEAIEYIYESERVDEAMQISVHEFKGELDQAAKWKILDVRQSWEAAIVKLPESELLTQELAQEMMQQWPKDTNILFYCHTGVRSLEAASYFKGHGLPNVKSLKGGIDVWAQEIDKGMQRYGNS